MSTHDSPESKCVDTVTVTDGDIADLQQAAGQAGDDAQVRLCQIALTQHDGDRFVTDRERDSARSECESVIRQVRAAKWDVGQLIESGDAGTEDFDTGRIQSIDGANGVAWIGWDSGVRGPCPLSALRERVRP